MTTPREVKPWVNRWIELCDHIAQWSKDPSHQFGAVIVGAGENLLSMGFNGFPRGVLETPESLNSILTSEPTTAEQILSRWERPLKYQFIVHAEENAILNAARNGVNLLGAAMYVNGHPCDRCAASIIQAGIKEVFFHNPNTDYEQRWAEAIKLAETMFQEAGVRVHRIGSGTDTGPVSQL